MLEIEKKQLYRQIGKLVRQKCLAYPGDFQQVDELIVRIQEGLQNGFLTRKTISQLIRCFDREFIENTVQGHGLKKPFGYAGDFLMIDKIYTFYKSGHPEFRFWDEYFHQHAATKAVRNRKEYFKRIINQKTADNPCLHLLNVASGPARDLYEMYGELSSPQKVRTTCVEMDKNAISYAKKLNNMFLSHIDFRHRNIFSYTDEREYDMIWSAGLFDYFNDKTFLSVLLKLKKHLKKGGEMIIGNFNEDYNPSRPYMEIFGEWFLHHRTEEQLLDLAGKAGFTREQTGVGREEGNVNLFLHIKN